MITSPCITETARWSSPIRASLATFVSITDRKNQTGGNAMRLKSSRVTSIKNTSTIF